MSFFFTAVVIGVDAANTTLIPVCNMLYGYNLDANGVTVCIKDASGKSRNATEVCKNSI